MSEVTHSFPTAHYRLVLTGDSLAAAGSREKCEGGEDATKARSADVE